MPKRIRKHAIPFDVTSFGMLFNNEGDGGGGKPADQAEPDEGASSGVQQGGDAKPSQSTQRGADDWQARFEGQQKVNRDLETKFNSLRDGLKGALGIEDKKADTTQLLTSLQDEISGLRRENQIEKVARRHKIVDENDLALLATATDADAMEKLATRLAPKGDEGKGSDASGKPGTPKPDSSQGKGGRDEAPKGSVASGRDLYAERHGKKKQSPSTT